MARFGNVSIRVVRQPRTRPQVIEPVTRMKPSEALRIGRMQYPDVSGTWMQIFPDGKKAFCAVGLINTIRGDDLQDLDPLNKSGLLFTSPCGCVGFKQQPLGSVVMHLSDQHDYLVRNMGRIKRLFRGPRFTQQGIIDWLEFVGQ